jgi:hypothetical protein
MPRIRRIAEPTNRYTLPGPERVTNTLHIDSTRRPKKLLELDRQHWAALQALTTRMNQKNSSETLRFLIRSKARELGCWSEHEPNEGA